MATRISISKCKVRGASKWRTRHWEHGKPKRRFFDSKAEAEAEAKSLREQADKAGSVWLSLSAYERNNLITAYAEAQNRGVDIHKAILAASGTAIKSVSLSTAIDELKASRLNNGRDAGYVNNLGIVLNQFAKGKESLAINKVTLADVESFLDSKSLQYRPTLRGKLSTLFNFSVRRGYRADNPCDRLESIKVVKPPPAVFTVEQVKAAVAWLKKHAPDGLPWFVLSTFCGLRPEEAEKTTKADIHFAEGSVRVEAQTTKVRQRRVVYPRPEAMACLKWAVKRGSLQLGGGRRRWILSGRKSKPTGLRGALGLKVWPKDITRHTAASYWLAGEGETVRHVAKMLGHSEAVCESRYKAVKTQKEAAEFWKGVLSITNRYSRIENSCCKWNQDKVALNHRRQSSLGKKQKYENTERNND